MQVGTCLVDKTGISFNVSSLKTINVFGIHLVCILGLQNKPIPVSHKLSWNLDFPRVLELRTYSL